MAGGRYSERGVGYRDEQHAISETPVSGPDSPDAAAAAATACLHSLHQEFCPAINAHRSYMNRKGLGMPGIKSALLYYNRLMECWTRAVTTIPFTPPSSSFSSYFTTTGQIAQSQS